MWRERGSGGECGINKQAAECDGVVWREQASGGEREESGQSGAETSSEQPVARRDKAFDDSRPRRMEAVAVSYRHTKG